MPIKSFLKINTMSEPIITPDAVRVSIPRDVSGLLGPRKIVCFRTDYDNLSNGEKKALAKEAEKYNVPKDKFIEYYNSGRLHPLLYTEYHGGKWTNKSNNSVKDIVVFGRLKENDSKFDPKESERFENSSNSYIWKTLANEYPAKPNLEYMIPYIDSLEIKVPGVGRVSTNALDSLAKYAVITKTPLSEALGLSAQETQFGAIPSGNMTAVKTKQDALNNRHLANMSYFRNFGWIPAEYLVRDFRYNYYPIDRTVPPLQHAFEYWNSGNYNNGDPKHTKMVRDRGESVIITRAIQDWISSNKNAQKALTFKSQNPK